MKRPMKLVCFLLLGLAVTAGAQFVPNPPPVNAPTNTLAATTSLTVGSATPTPITNIRVYSSSITPGATSAAIQTSTQTFALVGVTAADKIYVVGPAPTTLCPMVSARVSATDQIAIDFTVLTAVACTPVAGTYLIVAIRS